MPPEYTEPSGSAPTMRPFPPETSLRSRPAPLIVPPVPMPAMKCVIRPSVCSHSSGPVEAWCDAGFSGLAYWFGFHAPSISVTRRSDTW